MDFVNYPDDLSGGVLGGVSDCGRCRASYVDWRAFAVPRAKASVWAEKFARDSAGDGDGVGEEGSELAEEGLGFVEDA